MKDYKINIQLFAEDGDQSDMDDIEIAELANKELKKKAEENAKLKKELAKAKLLSMAEEDETESLTKEECLTRITNGNITNYEYVEAVCNLVDVELADNRPNPLGKNGDEVYKFFKSVLEECDGDKHMFPSIYQARLGADDSSITMAYNKRKNA